MATRNAAGMNAPRRSSRCGVGIDAWLAVILGSTLPPWLADPLILRAYGLR